MAQYEVTSAQLTNVKNELNSYNEQFIQRVSDLEAKQQELKSMWQGDANNTFDAAFHLNLTCRPLHGTGLNGVTISVQIKQKLTLVHIHAGHVVLQFRGRWADTHILHIFQYLHAAKSRGNLYICVI